MPVESPSAPEERGASASRPGRWFAWVLLVALGLVAVLFAVMVIRALGLRTRQPTATPVKLLSLEDGPVHSRLQAALRLPTVSNQDPALEDRAPFAELRAHLARAFPRVHRAMPPERVGEDSLLFTWRGREPDLPHLLLLAHLDVVPADEATLAAWTHPPFSGKISGGFAWGRGALDDKSRAIATLEALEHLLGNGFVPRRTITLALGHDEEVGGHRGARKMAALLERRGVRSFLTLDEGLAITSGMVPGVRQDVALVGLAEKGYVTLELLAEAPGGHSSMPPPVTAVGRLSRAVHRLEERPMPARLDGPMLGTLEAVAPEMPFAHRLVFANLWLFGPMVLRKLEAGPATNASVRTTFAPTMLSASPKENVLAQRARALVNVRIHPRDSVRGVLEHAGRVIGEPGVRVSALAGSASEPVPSSSTRGPAWRILARTVRQVFPGALVAPGLMVAQTDSRHYRNLGGDIFRFAPIRITDRDRERFHGVDERVGLRNYVEMISFFHQLIKNAAGD